MDITIPDGAPWWAFILPIVLGGILWWFKQKTQEETNRQAALFKQQSEEHTARLEQQEAQQRAEIEREKAELERKKEAESYERDREKFWLEWQQKNQETLNLAITAMKEELQKTNVTLIGMTQSLDDVRRQVSNTSMSQTMMLNMLPSVEKLLSLFGHIETRTTAQQETIERLETQALTNQHSLDSAHGYIRAVLRRLESELGMSIHPDGSRNSPETQRLYDDTPPSRRIP